MVYVIALPRPTVLSVIWAALGTKAWHMLLISLYSMEKTYSEQQEHS